MMRILKSFFERRGERIRLLNLRGKRFKRKRSDPAGALEQSRPLQRRYLLSVAVKTGQR